MDTSAAVREVSVYPDIEEKKAIRKRYFKAALVMLVDVLIFQLVSRVMLLVLGAADGTGGSIGEMMTRGAVLVQKNDISSVMYSCGFPIIAEVVAIAMGARMLGIDLWGKFRRNGYTGSEIIGGTAMSLFGQTASALIIGIISMFFADKAQEMTESVITAKSSFAANIIMYTYVCFLGPVLEELLFRGIVLESMKKYNERFAVVFSALIFGLMHGNIPQAVNGFVVGIVLGAVYVRSGSLVPPCIIHIFMNTLTSLLSVMMYSDPELLDTLMAGSFGGLEGLALAGIMINLAVRFISVPAGIAIFIVVALKGFGVRKASAAGKSRSTSLVLSSPLWWVVIVIYFGICIYNFI
ncbi:MAG: CPBP family intramembrane metalloprotease [Oscillospiraceae bacterium]|nr:CPBP family intramembrane metalloprotease [Oscillospiraceae bacterium]